MATVVYSKVEDDMCSFVIDGEEYMAVGKSPARIFQSLLSKLVGLPAEPTVDEIVDLAMKDEKSK